MSQEGPPGVYTVTLTHDRNSGLRFADYARGINETTAIAHARERLEEALAARPARSPHGTWPLTILATRKGGGYEGGAWAALPVAPQDIPEAVSGEGLECQRRSESPPFVVGLRATPDRSLAALDAAIARCDHPHKFQLQAPAGFVSDFCKQLRQQ